MKNHKNKSGFLSPLRITLIYLAVAALWITFTDQILEALVPDMETLSQFQTYKGLFYIAATSLGLYFLIKKYESQLGRSLREREALLQEVHHRVKNNLAVVSGFLQMQRMGTDSDKVEETLSKSETRIKSIALIHEKLYQADSLSNIDFKSYLEDLSISIRETMKAAEGIRIQINSDPITLNVNQAVPCAIILNELITNSLMHAFSESSDDKRIEVEFREKEGVISVKVQDNGEGISKEFDLASQPSMGFSIVQTLIDQLEASYSVNGQDGTEVSFSFKKESNTSAGILHNKPAVS